MRWFCVILSSVLMAAHCLRSGLLPLVVLCLLLPLLMRVRPRWGARVLQAALVLAAAEWVRTLSVIAVARVEEGRPWIRMAAILGSVALLTLVSVWMARPRGEPGGGKVPHGAGDGTVGSI